MKRVRHFLHAVVGACALGSVAHAATINYAPPSIIRPDITYTVVAETSATALPLYGAPTNTSATANSNTLSFNNLDFHAQANSAGTSNFVDGTLNLVLQANAGKTISSVAWNEGGDYNVKGSGVNEAEVFPQSFQITVLSVAGNGPTPTLIDNTSVQLNFSPAYDFFTNGTTPKFGSWSGSAVMDFATLFHRTDITSVSISYDNQLYAENNGGIATISKKLVAITPTLAAVAVPEPASIGLLAAGGLLLLLRRRA